MAGVSHPEPLPELLRTEAVRLFAVSQLVPRAEAEKFAAEFRTAVFSARKRALEAEMPFPFTYRTGRMEEAREILAFYKTLVGTPFCPWDDSYPAIENVRDDLAHGALRLLRDPHSGEIAVAGAFRPWEEHDSLAPWRGRVCCDLLRMGVAHTLQGHGLGRRFLSMLLSDAARTGYDSMRILVAETNLPARAMYEKSGAVFRGTAFSYGIHWLCCEVETRSIPASFHPVSGIFRASSGNPGALLFSICGTLEKANGCSDLEQTVLPGGEWRIFPVSGKCGAEMFFSGNGNFPELALEDYEADAAGFFHPSRMRILLEDSEKLGL